jgi:hypothetical protein
MSKNDAGLTTLCCCCCRSSLIATYTIVSGTSKLCPANAFHPATFQCRAATLPCDQAEFCTGSEATCPADASQPAGTVCRAQAGTCDQVSVVAFVFLLFVFCSVYCCLFLCRLNIVMDL